jgi:hypothetical protein
MSANAKSDLEQIKTAFENFRAGRTGKERLPETLWRQAIALLEHYPFAVVCRELRLKANYLRQRAAAVKQGHTEKFKLQRATKKRQARPPQEFLHLTAHDLNVVPSQSNLLPPTSACRVMIERTDGSRLQLTVPIDWTHIEALCAHFLRG